MEYQKQLLKRLLKMIEDNEKEMKYREMAHLKINKDGFTNGFNILTKNEKRAYFNDGYKHLKSAFKRIRIELNKAMIEWEKGE